jgi:putative hydrolase of the HAD superfamily
LPLGIISNWDTSIHAHVRERLVGLNFDHIIGSSGSALEKPDRRIYELALDRAGVSAAEVLYVGDSIRLDVAPAMAVGMKAILIDRDGLFPGFPGRIGSLLELNA